MSKKNRNKSPKPRMIANTPPTPVATIANTPAPSLGQPTREVKLDLACGQTPREGFEGIDLYAPDAKHKVDLFKFPWPFESDSVDELHCSHFIEHIPARPVQYDDLVPMVPQGETELVTGISYKHPARGFLGKDMFFAFFDECYRILKKTNDPKNPKGKMTVLCPCARNNRAFQDPTHRRFIVAETFLYLNSDWRKLNRLDHYLVNCNFGCNVNPIVPQELTLRAPEWQNLAFSAYWNTVIDFQALLVALQ